ncbi:MAG: hypothetical protein A2806_01360 [Candidatus Terrybacteria bacterium RIFCSPHIGHO2_01_FULL_48_17]|uniref:Uncharacterized protein n=1 Tax=Candidatus Terrybacteria bacterium RIFCSPHIGHO2_01_FULL_48_17 TaxID=1802362 RepID=A0A1G2PIX4_9BACT|nr:MAG: hypothetical protein A2806_01360 [Candidatus Terrybacteria bacterium RIFCSPHIGHO2_01_FULL_48_17]OHA52250.1 MAG: hypothetical protein A3A30_04615 [Candidatus Terrybacteria bacterium RIFCSPLOWO2_01_FULL_48_14]
MCDPVKAGENALCLKDWGIVQRPANAPKDALIVRYKDERDLLVWLPDGLFHIACGSFVRWGVLNEDDKMVVWCASYDCRRVFPDGTVSPKLPVPFLSQS